MAVAAAIGEPIDNWSGLTVAAPLRARDLHLTVRRTHLNVLAPWAPPLVSLIDRTVTDAVTLLFTTVQTETERCSALYECAQPVLRALRDAGGLSLRCLQFNFAGLPLPWGDPPHPQLDLSGHGADTLWFVWPSTPVPTKRVDPHGFCDFLDALGGANVHVHIENDPDRAYTQAQLGRPECKRKRAPTASAVRPDGTARRQRQN